MVEETFWILLWIVYVALVFKTPCPLIVKVFSPVTDIILVSFLTPFKITSAISPDLNWLETFRVTLYVLFDESVNSRLLILYVGETL